MAQVVTVTDFLAANLIEAARRADQRAGQYLFNNLPDDAANCMMMTLWDPFHKRMSFQEFRDWINDHLILEDGATTLDGVIAVFNNNEILWEKVDG